MFKLERFAEHVKFWRPVNAKNFALTIFNIGILSLNTMIINYSYLYSEMRCWCFMMIAKGSFQICLSEISINLFLLSILKKVKT